METKKFCRIKYDKHISFILSHSYIFKSEHSKKKKAAMRLKGKALYVEVAFIGSEPRINVFSV